MQLIPVNHKKFRFGFLIMYFHIMVQVPLIGVPAHDERDFRFAQKFGLPDMIKVVRGEAEGAFTGNGIHFNSGIIDGLNNEEAKAKIIEYLEKLNKDINMIHNRLRDWAFQDKDIGVNHFLLSLMKEDGIHMLDDSDLPLELPILKKYQTKWYW